MQEICRLSDDGGRFLRARHFEARQKAADYVGCVSGPVSSSPSLMLPTTRSVRFRPRRARGVMGFKVVFAFHGFGIGYVLFSVVAEVIKRTSAPVREWTPADRPSG